jgi:small subunit ribosomal protein S20
MPNIKSAKKRVRQTEKRTLRNRAHKERLKKAVRAFGEEIKGADVGKRKDAVSKIQKAVDKAGVKGIIHKNTVNRKKSRLAKAANRAAS